MAGSDWDMFLCDKNQYMQSAVSCWVGEVGEEEKQEPKEMTKAAKRVPVIQTVSSNKKLNSPAAPNHEYSSEFENVSKPQDSKVMRSDSNVGFSLVDVSMTSNRTTDRSTGFELFPPNINNSENCNQEFDFELLDDQFETQLLAAPETAGKQEHCSEKFSTNIDGDILNSVVSKILTDEQHLELASIHDNKSGDISSQPKRSDEQNLECASFLGSYNSSDILSKPLRKGKKRGRKLGYRSETSNDDNAICGVCGAKVRH